MPSLSCTCNYKVILFKYSHKHTHIHIYTFKIIPNRSFDLLEAMELWYSGTFSYDSHLHLNGTVLKKKKKEEKRKKPKPYFVHVKKVL